MISIASGRKSKDDIVKSIIDYIDTNDLAPGTPLSTAKKLALKYNVSPVTINRAMCALVDKGYLYRVQGSGTFVAKRQTTEQSPLVGFFIWRHRNGDPLNQAAYNVFEDALLTELKDFGFTVDFIAKAPSNHPVFNENVGKYDALIIPAGMVTDQTTLLLEKLDIPVITIRGEGMMDYPFHQVFQDYLPGFKKALAYILSKGHKKIYVASTNCETSRVRKAALCKCLPPSGLDMEELPIKASIPDDFVMLIGREQGKHFMDNKLDGVIFALSDFLAFGIIDAMQEKGLKPGIDIKLISYDNLESRGACPYGEPVLTSITHPLLELASETAKLTKDALKNNISCKAITKIIRVPANELVTRKSF